MPKRFSKSFISVLSVLAALCLFHSKTRCQAQDVSLASKPITDCQKLTSCSCKSSTLGVVDLTPLASVDGTPRFANLKALTSSELYSWNPCIPFTQGTCKNVAACQSVTYKSTAYYSLGTQESAKFVVDDRGLLLVYSANTFHSSRNSSQNFLRTAYIKLICEASKKPGQLVANGEDPSRFGHYYFTLESFHACPDKLKPKPSHHKLSVGSCLMIALAVAVFLYCSVGVLVQIFALKKSGLDIIPNRRFWFLCPGLVKDGVMFVAKRGKSETYFEFK